MKSLVYSISFLIGFFITISIYLIYTMYPHTFEEFTGNTEGTLSSTQRYIPQYNNNLLLFTTFNKDNLIKSTKWFDEDVSPTNENTKAYLNFTNTLNFVDDAKNHVKVAKLKNVELKAPLALYFANNTDTYEITEFTILFMLNFKAISGSHTLFEMLCNTGFKNDSSTTNPEYFSQVVSINVESRSSSKVRLTAQVGQASAFTDDFDINLLKSDKPVLISLSYDKSKQTEQVTFKIDKHTDKKYTIPPLYLYSMYAGTAPVIINKSGEIDCEMYSMAYYTKALTSAEIDQYKAFNEYYINGINKYDQQSAASQKAVADANANQKENAKKLAALQKTLEKCISFKSNTAVSSDSSDSSNSSDSSASTFNIASFDIQLPSTQHRKVLGF